MFKMFAAVLLSLAICCPPAAASPLAATPDQEKTAGKVQVFDVARGKVIHTTDNDEQYQAFAAGWLKGASGVAAKANPDPKCGYVFRVPLKAPVPFQAGHLRGEAVEVFLFYCPGRPETMLVVDKAHKAYLLDVKTDIAPFLQKIGVPTL